MTATENQQTVEAALTHYAQVSARRSDDPDWTRYLTEADHEALAALRDLVAQAAADRSALVQIDHLPEHRPEFPGLVKQIVANALRPIPTVIGGAMSTPRRFDPDTIEYRIYSENEGDINDEQKQDAVATAVNVALEQLKRDLRPLGLEVEADF
jgi:hypothetical protein